MQTQLISSIDKLQHQVAGWNVMTAYNILLNGSKSSLTYFTSIFPFYSIVLFWKDASDIYDCVRVEIINVAFTKHIEKASGVKI